MQQWGFNYWETYAPVINWISVRFLLILSKLAGLESRIIDFVLALPQEDIDEPVYMELPIGMEVPGFIKQNRDGFKAVTVDTSTLSSDGIDHRGGSSVCNDDAANPQI